MMQFLNYAQIERESSQLRAQARRFANQAKNRIDIGSEALEGQVMTNLEAAYIGRQLDREQYQSYPLSLGGGMNDFVPSI